MQFLHIYFMECAILKNLRLEKKLTQKQAAQMLGISLRSYITYENKLEKANSIKYNYLIETLKKFNLVDETHGILSLETIKNKCSYVLAKFDIEYCYLFGSYAKNEANEQSDVDLLISTKIMGLKYFEIVENLREVLHKNVDVLNIEQLKSNFELTQEILRDGIKIYACTQE